MNLDHLNIAPCVPVPTVPYGPVLVPCHINLLTGQFEPLLMIHDVYPNIPYVKSTSEEASEARPEKKLGRWCAEEDERVRMHVEMYGTQSWAQISRELNNTYHDGRSVRLGKHCRERWYNHLNPDLKKTEWTAEEDQILLSLYQEMGSSWSKIAKHIPGRTENHVKNRWNSLARKAKSHLESQAELELMQGLLTPETK